MEAYNNNLLLSCATDSSSFKLLFNVSMASNPCLAIFAADLFISGVMPEVASLLFLPATFITLIWLATLMLPETTVLTLCWKLILSLLLLLLLL